MASAADNSDGVEVPASRSRGLELIGLVTILGFFIGIFLAWRTQVSGLVTDHEFSQLKTGQTVSEVNQILGQSGELLHDTSPTKNEVTYVWRNSTDSTVTCIFEDNRLIRREAVNLP